ncbi:MAG: TetR/AcrR family transcriptional regulator [Segniliparus sp.]|uniref:TetR/AcrR family transcriptional regulator n=1 Tax=Segniliparus sp. TaxID=2804064 RepID=UPI003F3B1843
MSVTTDTTGERILDAALDELLRFGIRRATVEGIAKRAGVSHMTVYRRWPAKNDLVLAVVMREIEGLFAHVDREIAALESFEDKLVAGFVGIYWFARVHPLLGRTLETDPEAVLPVLTTGAAPSLEMAISYLAGHIERAAAAEDVVIDARGLAEIFVRLTHSLLVSPGSAGLADQAEVEEYARLRILPIAQAAMPSRYAAGRGA